jgi:hypothetical protein
VQSILTLNATTPAPLENLTARIGTRPLALAAAILLNHGLNGPGSTLVALTT